MARQVGVPAAWYRGGTSAALIVRADDLPSQDRAEIGEWLLAAYGSPDVRQIDGLGGGDGQRSKFAIVAPPSRPDADLDYTFVQLGVNRPDVNWSLMCGNISSAIGPYAIDEGLVPAVEPVTRVRIHNTNTGRLILADVQVEDGHVVVDGDTRIDGVPGTSAPVFLDYSDGAGTVNGRMLPTGNVRDTFQVEGVGAVEVSVVDVTLPMLFIPAERLGATGSEPHAQLVADLDLRAKIAQIRRTVCAELGWATSVATADAENRLNPAACIVGPAAAWTTLNGLELPADYADFAARAISVLDVHKSFMVTGTIAAGAAAAIEGTVVHDVTSPAAHARGSYRLGHPSGVSEAFVELDRTSDTPRLARASMVRTARRMFDGTVYVPASRLPWYSASAHKNEAIHQLVD